MPTQTMRLHFLRQYLSLIALKSFELIINNISSVTYHHHHQHQYQLHINCITVIIIIINVIALITLIRFGEKGKI